MQKKHCCSLTLLTLFFLLLRSLSSSCQRSAPHRDRPPPRQFALSSLGACLFYPSSGFSPVFFRPSISSARRRLTSPAPRRLAPGPSKIKPRPLFPPNSGIATSIDVSVCILIHTRNGAFCQTRHRSRPCRPAPVSPPIDIPRSTRAHTRKRASSTFPEEYPIATPEIYANPRRRFCDFD